jgi:hypothetical protein
VDSREAAHLTLPIPAGIKRHYNSYAVARAAVANRMHPRQVFGTCYIVPRPHRRMSGRLIKVMSQPVDPLEDAGRLDFTKSYQLTRLIVGVIGVTLPLVLIVFDALIFEQFSIRRSLSAYYHSGVRDWFVGSLCAIGVGLFTYMGTRLGSFDNWVSTTAGVCAIVVAFFPVKTAAAQMPTELQTKLGEALVQSIHFTFAAIFLTLLGLMSLRFGIGDGRRPDRTARQRKGWRVVHFACAGAIWLSVIALIVIKVAKVSISHGILIGEVVAIEGFGLSWFLKGSELFSIALGRDRVSKERRAQHEQNPQTSDALASGTTTAAS